VDGVTSRPPRTNPRKKGRELYVPRLPAGCQSAALRAVAELARWLAAVSAAGPVVRTFDYVDG